MVKTGISLDSVKNNNKSQILKILQKNGAMSRKDIANQIGLTPAAVTMRCNDMMEAHMILEKGEMKEQKRAGRKKVLVDINYDFKYIVSVNIEAVDTSITVTNIRGNVLVETKVHTRTDIEPQLFLEELAKEIKLQLWEKELKLSDILGIGICVPGIVDRNNGISIHAYGIWNNQVKIREILEKQIQCPVILENNVKAFAEAEMLYGVGKYGNNIVFIKWGPGVGSAIVVDNKLYEGNQHNAAEIGHYIIEPDGLKCRCGRHGCLETRVSMFALCDRIKEIYSKENTPVLYEETAGDKNLITRELLTSWVENEGNGYITRMDKTISEILVGAIERMARVAVNVLTILAPDYTIVFGSMFENTSIYKLFIQYCTKYDENYTDKLISRSHLSDKMAYIGGTALIASTYFFESKNL